jgi:hypothetical protein
MEYKPIAIMILSLFIIWILILGTMAATGNAQEGTIQPESNFTGNIKETQSGNEHECFDEFAQLETCIANPENGATTQESSNTRNATEVANNPGNATEGANNPGNATEVANNPGNATEVANNPAPLQEMVPAFHITTKQLQNGLTVEKPAASTNPDCNRTVCVEHAPHTPVTAEQLLGRQTSPPAFILAINGAMVTGKQCSGTRDTQDLVIRNGVEYTICVPKNTNTQVPPSEATKPQQLPSTPLNQPCTNIQTCGQR